MGILILFHMVHGNVEDKIYSNINSGRRNMETRTKDKPGEVGRIMPAFWDILAKAKEQGVSLHNLSSHGMYALNSAFDREYYDDILEFLGVKFMDNEWYAMCIQSSSLVFGLSEDAYLELLFFVADNWWSHFQSTNMKKIPLLKYVGQDGYLYTCSFSLIRILRMYMLISSLYCQRGKAIT